MQALMADCMNVSDCQYSSLPLGLAHYEKYAAASTSVSEPVMASRTWALKLTAISVISIVWISTQLQARRASKSSSAPAGFKDPPQVPYFLPVLGNLLSYLLNPFGLASSIRQTFGASSVVRLNFLSKDIYLVSGAEYLHAVWKNTKGLTSTNGINISLEHMFATSKEDMKVFEADDSGITHDSHPQSSVKPEDRVFYLVHKATVDSLAGPNLKIAAQRFKDALMQHIEASPTTEEWVEMDDLFGFVRPLISRSTIQAMCGASFLRMFPEFFDDFWYFNMNMPKLLHRCPRWMVPRAWQARDRCIAVMKKWRKEFQGRDDFDGSAMIPQRWACFSNMRGLSDDGVACSDVGILWGMNSNSMPAAFWLIWHMLRDQNLLVRASREVDACRTSHPSGSIDFDTAKLIEQPLLQSCFAEALRKYTAVFLIRQPEHEDAQVLDYRVPQGKMMVINSAMAHTDRRNWNTGTDNEHPVDSFWSDRFLTYGSNPRGTISEAPSTAPGGTGEGEPRFSVKGYSGAWIPFGGGIHQCPARHWVKAQMLFSFAAINAAFEIDILHPRETLRLDTRKYGLGVMQPGEKARFRIRRRKAAA